jgi:hypothetical protein
MNDERRPSERPTANNHPPLTIAPRVAGARQTTGLQAGTAILRGALEGAREALPPREYATLVDVAARILERERKRTARWAA